MHTSGGQRSKNRQFKMKMDNMDIINHRKSNRFHLHNPCIGIENVIGFYPKASLEKRFLALLLDELIFWGLAIPAMIIIMIHNSPLPLIILADILLILSCIYRFIKDGLGKGQSWGKKAVGLMVVYLPNNTLCSIEKSCLRCLIGCLITTIPLFGWLIEPIMILVTQDGRRLADKVAGTQVIEINRFGLSADEDL